MLIENEHEIQEGLTAIVMRAGDAIMEVYTSDDQDVQVKADDSPVTRADNWAHQIIVQGLMSLDLGYPILSEEGVLPTFLERQSWGRYWLVDPLDGTKEFLNRTGEFTVNIALVEDNKPVMGIVYVPASRKCYFGGKALGAWVAMLLGEGLPEWKRIESKTLGDNAHLKVVASRRHGSEKMDRLLDSIRTQALDYTLVNIGSSLKICLLAEGEADWYPRLALTCEWDTAAAQAVLEGAGGVVMTENLESSTYNRKDSMLNPFFHCFGDPEFNWRQIVNG